MTCEMHRVWLLLVPLPVLLACACDESPRWRSIDTEAWAAAITTDGEVVFWGYDEADGEGGGEEFPPSLPDSPQGQFEAISIAGLAYCGIRQDRTVVCDDTWSRLPAEPTGDSEVLDVAVATQHGCAVLGDGTLTCWHAYPLLPLSPPPGDVWVQVEVAGAGSAEDITSPMGCARDNTGALSCWGNGTGARLSPPPGSGFQDFSLGLYWGCAIAADGRLNCWGDEEYMPATPDGAFVQVDVAFKNACAITEEADVVCWGSNVHYEQPDLPGPIEPPAGRFLEVAAGGPYACGIREDRSIECWGSVYTGAHIPPE